MLLLCEKESTKDKIYKYIFRLTAILFLVLIINPVQYFPWQELFAQEHDINNIDGVGGGYFSEELFTDTEADIMLTSVSLESIVKPRMLLYDFHTIQSGDNIYTLAINYGLNQDTIVSLNEISNSRLLQIGRVLKLPNQDGIFHTVRNGEDINSITERYNADQEAIIATNELFSDYITVGTNLFIPGARLDWTRLQEINGDLFIRPVNGVITSSYGWRRNPFNRNLRQFHNGIDIRGSIGDPVRAAMAGRVSAVGWDNVLGNYIIINHHSGYRTLYGHLSTIRTRTGVNVAQGERIGDVGNSGQSTGPHLHFTVFRNGITVNPIALMR